MINLLLCDYVIIKKYKFMKPIKILFFLMLIGSIMISCDKDKDNDQDDDVVTPVAGNIILNGDFEDLENNLPSNWDIVDNKLGNPDNSILIDSLSIDTAGVSLKFHHAEDNGCWEMWIDQSIDKSKLSANTTYKLTLDYMSDFNHDDDFSIRLRNSTVNLSFYPPIEFVDDSNWHQLSYEFTTPSDIGNNDLDFKLHFCIPVIGDWWIDNINLKKVE